MLHHRRHRARVGRRGWVVTCLATLAVSLPLAAAGIAPASVAPGVAPTPRDVTLAAPSPTPHAEPAARPAPAPRRQAAGSIGATLVDQFGGSLSGATVTLTNVETGAQFVTQSDAAGRFVFRSLQPATYHVVASLAGFKSGAIDVTLTPGASIAPTLTLGLGTVHETIHVLCGEPSAAVRLLEMSTHVRDVVFPRLYAQGTGPATGTLRPPTKIHDVRPVCPAALASAETTLHIVGHIGVNGSIEDAAPVPAAAGSEPPAELVQSAIDAVRGWVFAPTLLDGQTVPTEIAVDITFAKS